MADMLPRSILPRRGAAIPGQRPATTSSPGQLTIDEWEQELERREDVKPRGRGPTAEARSSPHQPTAKELLETPGALLTRTHLRQLGLERRAVDAVFRALPVVSLPGYSRPMIRAEEYRDLLAHSTFDDDRVRPMRPPATATAKVAVRGG
ncbi:MAG TPA: hypothetical protein VM290_03850 [Gaiellaceae bacterium]|nr:hypothetical protein [Gaiellaceae bacterium]